MDEIFHATPRLTGKRLPSEQVTAIQRARVLSAALHLFGDAGYGQVTTAQIIALAHVSRTSFYELFGDRDDCLAAILDVAVQGIERELEAAQAEELAWHERVGLCLVTALEFFDERPGLARVCVVEALRGGPVVLERRAAILRRLAAVLDEGRLEHASGAHCTSLTAEGLVGAVFAIVHARLLRGHRAPLADLAPELTRMLLLPYTSTDAPDDEAPREPRSLHRRPTQRSWPVIAQPCTAGAA